jgi:O-antigen biosynthesis protein WbqP
LTIELKAALDGEYVEKMSLGMDFKCFAGTIISVLKREGVIEGGTGALDCEEAAVISYPQE